MLSASAALVVVLLGDVVVRGGALQAVLIAPWLLAALWAVYVFSFASHVTTDADGVTVQNLLRRIRVPWGRVTAIELRWQLLLTLDDGATVRSFGGPVLSRRGALRSRAAPDTATEQTGEIIDDWLAAKSAASAASVRRGWDLPAVLALAVIVVWAAVSVAVAAF